MSCRSGCPTKDHETWGDCARAAAIQIDRHALTHSRRAERDKDNNLARYASLRKAGVQPATTQWADVRAAEEYGGVQETPVLGPGEAPAAPPRFVRED